MYLSIKKKSLNDKYWDAFTCDPGSFIDFINSGQTSQRSSKPLLAIAYL